MDQKQGIDWRFLTNGGLLAGLAVERRTAAVAYVAFVFIVLPLIGVAVLG